MVLLINTMLNIIQNNEKYTNLLFFLREIHSYRTILLTCSERAVFNTYVGTDMYVLEIDYSTSKKPLENKKLLKF